MRLGNKVELLNCYRFIHRVNCYPSSKLSPVFVFILTVYLQRFALNLINFSSDRSRGGNRRRPLNLSPPPYLV